MNEPKYYDAVFHEGAYHGRLYHFDSTGNREIVDWCSPEGFDRREHAEDAVCAYLEEHGIDAELGG